MITTMMAMLEHADPASPAGSTTSPVPGSIGGLPFQLAPAMLVGLLLLAIALLRGGCGPHGADRC